MSSFEGKVAAITGAGSGMGRALAIDLVRRGCEVALSDVNEVGLAETVALISGRKVTSARVDVSQRDEVFAWAERVAADHGRCHFIFNNAGVALAATAEEIDPKDFAWIFGINFWGVVNGTQAFMPHLRASGDGHVVNTSSIFGIVAFPGNGAYNATKFAVRGYTEALAIELAAEDAPVRVTSVHPGGVKTAIAKSARMHDSVLKFGDAEEQRRTFEKAFRLSPERAAEIILDGVANDESRVLVGNDAVGMDLVQRLVPSAYKSVLARFTRWQQEKLAKRAGN